MEKAPKRVLVVGHGVFGLSTALSLSLRPSFENTTITLIDRSPFPSQDGSSTDTSRIIRSDYSDPAYAHLAAEAMAIWRSSSPPPSSQTTKPTTPAQILAGLGQENRYTESGLVLVCNKGQQGEDYVRHSLENMRSMPTTQVVRELKNRAEIEKAVGTGGGSGDWGYINTTSGWADAEASMLFLREKVESLGRVKFLVGEVTSLIFDPSTTTKSAVRGVKLKSGSRITADLTILSTGAWTPSLISLSGRATSTGQALCYTPISPSTQATLSKNPVLLNMSTGMFIIPPSPLPGKNILKVARHGYGYANPATISNPEGVGKVTISLPRTTWDDKSLSVPLEGQAACKKALQEMIPSLSTNPFTTSKICWYTDTSSGDFIICRHPSYTGLFLATGGSGHGFKFLPVIGERIVDVIEERGKGWEVFGKAGKDGRGQWGWPVRKERGGDNVVTEDGSRGGGMGMVLDEELGRSRERKGSRL